MHGVDITPKTLEPVRHASLADEEHALD